MRSANTRATKHAATATVTAARHEQHHGGDCRGPGYGGNRKRHDERLTRSRFSENALGAVKDHAQRDQEQDDAAGEVERALRQSEELEEGAAERHAYQQHGKRDRALAHDHPDAAFRIDVSQQRDEQGDVADRIGHEQQDHDGGSEGDFHGASLH